jgi:diacylglycerol O-acyltransferase / wax synthase
VNAIPHLHAKEVFPYTPDTLNIFRLTSTLVRPWHQLKQVNLEWRWTMTKLRQLTPQDVMFVGGETPNVYQHTAGLILLDSSGRPDFGFEAFRRHTQERTALIPHFHWRLHEVPLGLDLPYWVEDENFSYDHHIRRIAVPSPGDREALAELVAYLYCRHLDRGRPLWETWFIEGLADGKYAVLQKMHHCMMDGEGAVKMGEIMWDHEPDAPPPEVDPDIADARPGQAPELWQQSFNAARSLSRLPLLASREIYDALRHNLSQRMSRSGTQAEKPMTPNTSFNDNIGSGRGLVYCSLPLADIKVVKSHFEVTVNDVLLALVGGSLRDYLLAQGDLPDESLRTSIPVSLRTEADDNFSNKVTTTEVTLATDIADPVQRLREIARESGAAKLEAHGGGNKGPMEIVGILPPLLVNALIRITPGDRVAGMMGSNVVVSNVRGSPNPMYIGGARMTNLYPMSIIAPGGGINITCGSYADSIHVGVTIEPELVPDPWLIVDGLQKALQEYLAQVGKSAGGRKKTAVKSRATKSKRTAAGKKIATKKVAKKKVATKRPSSGSKKVRPKRAASPGKV